MPTLPDDPFTMATPHRLAMLWGTVTLNGGEEGITYVEVCRFLVDHRQFVVSKDSAQWVLERLRVIGWAEYASMRNHSRAFRFTAEGLQKAQAYLERQDIASCWASQ